MEITRIPGEGRVRLDLVGRLDATWSQHVAQTLSECVRAGQHEIALDLEQVTFLSSAGIRVLLVTHRQLVSIGGRLVIIAASEVVRHVLELAGMRALLAASTRPAAAAEGVAVGAPPAVRLERPGASYDVHVVAPGARILVRAIGDPTALLRRGTLAAELPREAFPPRRIAVGIGAFGDDPGGCRERLGELLAVGGAAVSLPSCSAGQPDWLVREGQLVPEARLAYGLVGEGDLEYAVRFEADAEAGPLGLDGLVATAFEVARADALAIAIVAETAQVVGAALRRSPAERTGGVFGFPTIRDEIDFTAEPAHAGTVTVVAGFVTRDSAPGGAPHPRSMDRDGDVAAHFRAMDRDGDVAAHLRPMDRGGDVAAHLHAAVFPYRPLRRGRIELEETVCSLFETQTVVGLLHLVNDWRPGIGAGQTRFHRGALWCGPFDRVGAEGTRP